MTACAHPATALRCWYANDPTAPNGRILVICCANCHTVIRGGAKLT